jgi:hypothetical protein
MYYELSSLPVFIQKKGNRFTAHLLRKRLRCKQTILLAAVFPTPIYVRLLYLSFTK